MSSMRSSPRCRFSMRRRKRRCSKSHSAMLAMLVATKKDHQIATGFDQVNQCRLKPSAPVIKLRFNCNNTDTDVKVSRAESFNRAAGRIEQLVGAHRMLLANASHELRTPLSRIRLALDLFERSGEAKYKTDLERDITELEALIEEILLASRLDAMPALQMTEDVDLLALAAEECARYDDCTLDGEAVSVIGDPRL